MDSEFPRNDGFDSKDVEAIIEELRDAPEEVQIEDQDLRLLKGIIQSEKSGKEFANNYDHTLFVGDAREFARIVLGHIKTYRQPPTRRVVLDQLDNDSELYSKVDYIWDKIDKTEYDVIEFNYDLEKLKNRYSRSKIINISRNLDEALDEADVDYDEVLRKVRRDIERTEQLRKGKRQVFTQATLKNYMPEFREEFIRKLRGEIPKTGIKTGYSYLDYASGGIEPAEMVVIGGESSSGKSMMLNNIAIQMWMQNNTIYTDAQNYSEGHNVMYFSLEMPMKGCVRRTLARLAGVPTYGIRDCTLKQMHAESLSKASKFIANYPFDFEIVDIPRGATVEQIEERYVEAVDSGNTPDIVFVDYLGLMEAPDVSGEDWLKLGYIAGKLHEFGRMYDTRVFTAVQLNRAPSKTNVDSSELIGMHRIGRSSLIMHHANIGIQIETRKDEQTYADFIYHLIKMRDGELGRHILSKNFKQASITELNPYEPPVDDSNAPLMDDIEDISKFLEEIGWE